MERFSFSIKFGFSSGVKARDYGSASENKDIIKSIEHQAEVATLLISEIEQENKEGFEIVNEYSSTIKYSMEYFFAVLFVGLTVGLTYAQYQIIKNHLLVKKYI